MTQWKTGEETAADWDTPGDPLADLRAARDYIKRSTGHQEEPLFAIGAGSATRLLDEIDEREIPPDAARELRAVVEGGQPGTVSEDTASWIVGMGLRSMLARWA